MRKRRVGVSRWSSKFCKSWAPLPQLFAAVRAPHTHTHSHTHTHTHTLTHSHTHTPGSVAGICFAHAELHTGLVSMETKSSRSTLTHTLLAMDRTHPPRQACCSCSRPWGVTHTLSNTHPSSGHMEPQLPSPGNQVGAGGRGALVCGEPTTDVALAAKPGHSPPTSARFLPVGIGGWDGGLWRGV